MFALIRGVSVGRRTGTGIPGRGHYRDGMQFDGLHAVADYAALYALLRQDALERFLDDELGDYRTDADIAGRQLTFAADDRPEIRASTTLAAVLDQDQITWGWAHPDGDPHGVAVALREAGKRFGVADLVHPRVGLPGHLSGAASDQFLDEATDIVAAAAVGSTGISPHVTARLGDGSRAVLLLDGIELPEPTFADFATRMPGLLNALTVNDPRVAVHGLAARLGWHISWVSGDDSTRSPVCELTDGTSTAHIDFDRKGRPRGYRCGLATAG